MKTLVENRLGLIRKSRGVGASDLARRVRVSHRTIRFEDFMSASRRLANGEGRRSRRP